MDEPQKHQENTGAVSPALPEQELEQVTGGTKKVDKASPTLMQACCTGTHLKEGTITS